jgi:hypothetical protein
VKKAAKIFGCIVAALALLVIGGIAATWAPDRPVSELRARWAPPPSQFVEADGIEVHLRDEGPRDDPKPIVLLHGTSSSCTPGTRGRRRFHRSGASCGSISRVSG